MPNQIPQPDIHSKPELKHVKRELGLLFTTSLHAACWISTVTGQKCEPIRGPQRTPDGRLQIRWAFESTPVADEAFALWNSIGLESFGTPKDWNEMTLDEKKAVTNVTTAFAANLRLFLKQCH